MTELELENARLHKQIEQLELEIFTIQDGNAIVLEHARKSLLNALEIINQMIGDQQ